MRKIYSSFLVILMVILGITVVPSENPNLKNIEKDFEPENPTEDDSLSDIDYLVRKGLKNVIILIGDGLGFNHLNVSNLYQYGKYKKQVYERFPVKIGLSTFPADGSYDSQKAWDDFNYVNNGYTDSAAAATALSTGVKTNNGIIGLDSSGNTIKNVMEVAEDTGKSTGVVTSVQWSHATPASFIAHNENRNNYEEIAKEMVYESELDVIMGCGNPYFDSNGNYIEVPNTYKYVGGQQTWNDISGGIAGGDSDRDGDNDYWDLIQTREQFQSLIVGETPKRIIGIPQVYQTLQQKRGGDPLADPYKVPSIDTVPSLEEMTLAALNILDEDEDGFFLMIEGGAIDWASHSNQPGRLIEEIIEFNKAVESVINWVKINSNWSETLVVVTGDHETGYITGPNSGINADGKSFWNQIESNGRLSLPNFEFNKGGHTNSIIPFFAKGFSANLFKKTARNSIDPVRGNYMDNTDLGRILFKILIPNS